MNTRVNILITVVIPKNVSSTSKEYVIFSVSEGGSGSLSEVRVELPLGERDLVPGVKCRHPEIWTAAAPDKRSYYHIILIGNQRQELTVKASDWITQVT